MKKMNEIKTNENITASEIDAEIEERQTKIFYEQMSECPKNSWINEKRAEIKQLEELKEGIINGK